MRTEELWKASSCGSASRLGWLLLRWEEEPILWNSYKMRICRNRHDAECCRRKWLQIPLPVQPSLWLQKPTCYSVESNSSPPNRDSRTLWCKYCRHYFSLDLVMAIKSDHLSVTIDSGSTLINCDSYNPQLPMKRHRWACFDTYTSFLSKDISKSWRRNIGVFWFSNNLVFKFNVWTAQFTIHTMITKLYGQFNTQWPLLLTWINFNLSMDK